MSRMFLPVRAVCEIISRPVYYRDPQYNACIAGVLRNCHNPCVVAGSAIVDPVCLQILDKHHSALLEKFAKANQVKPSSTRCLMILTWNPRYDTITSRQSTSCVVSSKSSQS